MDNRYPLLNAIPCFARRILITSPEKTLILKCSQFTRLEKRWMLKKTCVEDRRMLERCGRTRTPISQDLSSLDFL